MIMLDQIAIDHIHKSTITGGIFEYLMAVFAVSFNNEIVAFVYALGLFHLPHGIKIFILCALLPSSGLLVTLVLKRKISRIRPPLFIPRAQALIFDFRGREKNHSMPSGDSLQATLFWNLMAHFQVVSGWTAAILAFFTMFARVYYMCHYPTDTFLGAFVGFAVFFTIKYLVLSF
jgi:membrane-associated phospholipid phosphatase